MVVLSSQAHMSTSNIISIKGIGNKYFNLENFVKKLDREIVKNHLLGHDVNKLYLTAGHEGSHVDDIATGRLNRFIQGHRQLHPNADNATLLKAREYLGEIKARTWQLQEATALRYNVIYYQQALNHFQNLYNGL